MDLARPHVGPEGKIFAHGAGITRLMPPMLPFPIHQLARLVRFAMDEQDVGQEIEIEYVLSGPGGELARTSVPVTVGPPEPAPGEDFYLSASLTIHGVPLTDPGVHTLSVQIAGEAVGVARLVVVAPDPGFPS